MQTFTFGVPQKIQFGCGAVKETAVFAKELKLERVLIISGRNLTKLGVVDKVAAALEAAGIQAARFVDIEPNPSVETVNAATKAYLKANAQGIIALGGGSPMDVAKAVGILAVYGGKITDYEGAGKVPGRIAPIIAIPTTAGTGSEVTAFTVITDTSRNYKLTVFSYELIPGHAILDPELLASTPPSVAAATGIDALVHAVEAYLSLAASPFTDAMAEKAISLIGANLRAFVANRQNTEAASAMLSASTFAGIAFAWARLGNVHAMAHPLGGYFHLAHGVANAILLPTVLEYNALADNGRYEKIYTLLTGKGKQDFQAADLVSEVRVLLSDLAIPATLSEAGVTEDKIPAMAVDAMKSGNILVNPRQSTQADIEALYRKAL